MNGPGFRSVREAAILLVFANDVWPPVRWVEWVVAGVAGLTFAWYFGENGLALDDAWLVVVVPLGIGLELYRTRRLAARARS